jgi:hypothetical protein
MSSLITPHKTDLGWIIELPPEVTRALGVGEGAIGVLHPRDGNLEVEVLPPPSPELIDEVNETWDEFREAFEEMKRRGD